MLFQNSHKWYHSVGQLIVCLLLVVATAAAAGGQSVGELLSKAVRPESGPWTWNRPFHLKHIVILEPIGEIAVGGATTFRLAIIQRTDSVSLTVNISKLSRLEYSGAMTWQTSPKKGDTVFFSFPVRISANDTAGMEVKVVNSNGKESEAACYVITTATPPNIWYGDPRLSDEYQLKNEPRQKFKHVQDDTLSKYTDSVLFHDEVGNIIGGDSALKILDSLNRKYEPKGSDSVWHGTT